MSTTEALRLQLDNARLEGQQLQVENAKLREEHPEEATLLDTVAQLERDILQLQTKNGQLQREYDQLLWDSQEEHAVLEDLQEKWKLQQVREESLQRRLEEAKSVAELEQYRVLEKERKRWEAREDRLVERLEEMQNRVQEWEETLRREIQQQDLSYSSNGEDSEEEMQARSVRESVSDNLVQLAPISGNREEDLLEGTVPATVHSMPSLISTLAGVPSLTITPGRGMPSSGAGGGDCRGIGGRQVAGGSLGLCSGGATVHSRPSLISTLAGVPSLTITPGSSGTGRPWGAGAGSIGTGLVNADNSGTGRPWGAGAGSIGTGIVGAGSSGTGRPWGAGAGSIGTGVVGAGVGSTGTCVSLGAVGSIGISRGAVTSMAGVGEPMGNPGCGVRTGGDISGGVTSGIGESEGARAVAAMSSALLAQQLPPLTKFDGDTSGGDNKETVKEWLEQFELVAGVCRWEDSAKLVNLVTRLRGEAYAFYKSCSPHQRGSYEEMAAALTRRFTPVRIQAVQSSLFHDRKQKERETVDSYAQVLRVLFHKAYPSAQRGSDEAEGMGKFVLASQFASGLLPEIKAKVAGSKGDLDTLLAKARFEEAKLRDLAVGQNKPRKFPASPVVPPQPEKTGGAKPGTPSDLKSGVRCYGCGSFGHYRNKCPTRNKGGPAEAPGKDHRGKSSGGHVANLAPEGPGSKSTGDGVQEALERVSATMYSISSKASGDGVQMGPVPTAEVELEGQQVQALLNTGSPVTIVSLEFLLQVLAKNRRAGQSPTDWKKEVEARLEPTPIALRSYGGGQLPVVRQVHVTLARTGHHVRAKVQVQRDAPAELLIGTDLLSELGFLLVRAEVDGKDVDMLQGHQQPVTPGRPGRGEIPPEKDSVSGAAGTVCLLQATKLPGRHSKLVRAEVRGSERQHLSYFEPDLGLGVSGREMSDAAVEVDGNNCVVVVLENHGYAPVELEGGRVLGEIQEVELCEVVDSELGKEGKLVSAVTSEDFSQERLQRLKEGIRVDDSNLTPEQIHQIEDLVLEYADVYAMESSELGVTDTVTHSINTGDSPPIKQPARRIPFALRGTVEEMVQKMLEQGVVEPSHSPWSSPVVLVEKKDGSRRFCVDYRRLNAVTKMDVYPLPRIDDTLDSLAGSQYFTTLDLASGYWQVRMDPESQEKTAFSTPSGHYEFAVMPFGLCNSPATFQRLMEGVLAGLSPDTCMVYIDDVIVTGKTFEEHLANLKEVLKRLRAAGLRLKLTKCFFAGSRVVYLGFVVSRDGISPDPQKVEAVGDFPQPHDVGRLRSFLGLASYYRRFIPGFSTVANPLFVLTRKNVDFVWSPACEKAFQNLKERLIEAPVLAFPAFDRGFLLDTDASGVGLGAVLAQKQVDGSIRPVAYASRTLQAHERRYGVTEMEALGVVWAVKHFRHYLYGHHCDVFTDHEALKSLMNTPHPSGKLARWGLALQEVDLAIFHRPGKKNVLADALSRSPVGGPAVDSLPPEEHLVAAIGGQDRSKSGEESLGDRQRRDAQLREIIVYLETGTLPSEERELALTRQQYVLLDGILHFVEKGKTVKVIPPLDDRKQLFEEVHGGVFDGELSKWYWWPGMRGDIILWCQACLTCASRQVGRATSAPLTPIPVAGAFDRVGVDVLHFPKSSAGNQYAIVFVDYLTKWPEVFAAPDQTAFTIAKLFVEEIVCRHGVPAQLLSDRGKAFLSQLMREVCEVLGVKKLNTTAYHPQTDGLVERFNRTLTSMLAKRVERNGTDWDVHLPYTLFAYRASLQESTGESPFYLMHGRDPRLPSALEWSSPPREVFPLNTYKEELVSGLSEAWELAQLHVKKDQKSQKRYYDRRAREADFKVGERVFVYMPQEKATKAYKFARPFCGPFRVTEVVDTGVLVRPVHRPQEESIRVALDRIRRCPNAIAPDVFWAGKKSGRAMGTRATKVTEKSVKVPEVPVSVWAGRLRGSVEDTLPKSGDM